MFGDMLLVLIDSMRSGKATNDVLDAAESAIRRGQNKVQDDSCGHDLTENGLSIESGGTDLPRTSSS